MMTLNSDDQNILDIVRYIKSLGETVECARSWKRYWELRRMLTEDCQKMASTLTDRAHIKIIRDTYDAVCDKVEWVNLK